jgi:thiol-disulfide isomerase/thioredoxin
MKSTFSMLAGVFLALFLTAGCQPQSGTSGKGRPTESLTTASSQPASVEAVKLDVASWDDVQKFIAAQQGKVVVVDLWSSSCEPCVRELPGLVKLHEEHPEEVVCVTVNLDYIGLADDPPENYRDAATKVLAERRATLQNFLSSTSDTDVYARLEVAAVPVVYVYGRDGKLAKRFDNEKDEYGKEGFTYADHIVPLVKELIAANDAAPQSP